MDCLTGGGGGEEGRNGEVEWGLLCGRTLREKRRKRLMFVFP